MTEGSYNNEWMRSRLVRSILTNTIHVGYVSKRPTTSIGSEVWSLGDGMGFWIWFHIWLSSALICINLGGNVGLFTMLSKHTTQWNISTAGDVIFFFFLLNDLWPKVAVEMCDIFVMVIFYWKEFVKWLTSPISVIRFVSCLGDPSFVLLYSSISNANFPTCSDKALPRFNAWKKVQQRNITKELELNTIQPFTNTLVVTSHKINARWVFAPQCMLRASCVSVAPRPRDQLNAKDTDVMSLPKCCWNA